MPLLRAINDKYDGSLIIADGRIITPQSEIKNILFYYGDTLFESPLIYIHPIAQKEPNTSVQNGIITIYSIEQFSVKGIWKLTGRKHPVYQGYLEAVFPD